MKLPKQRCQISTTRDQLRHSSKLAVVSILEITAAEPGAGVDIALPGKSGGFYRQLLFA
jgi:hypothetical protein